MSKHGKGQTNDFLKAFALLTQMGIMIVVCIAIGLLAGFYLDRWLGTEPLFLILFILFGIAAAIKSIVDFSKKF